MNQQSAGTTIDFPLTAALKVSTALSEIDRIASISKIGVALSEDSIKRLKNLAVGAKDLISERVGGVTMASAEARRVAFVNKMIETRPDVARLLNGDDLDDRDVARPRG